MLPVVRAIRRRSELQPLVVSTGQHREMLDQVFESFDEKPDLDLAIMTRSHSLQSLTRAALKNVSQVIAEHAPAMVIVHGDTTTAMASALAAFYADVPVAHVEAGLRSHDIRKPWPEEFNRVAIDAIATLLFAPTDESARNLARESPRQRVICVTGNTGIDALLHISQGVKGKLPASLATIGLQRKKLVLVTGHRRESFGDGFRNICMAIRTIASRPDVEVVFPVHLNPNVRDVVGRYLSGHQNIHLLDPVPYEEMVALMCAARLILTDSGGIQEEGPALGKPVVVMRDVTERPEGVATGVVSLVGTDPSRIAREVCNLLEDSAIYNSRARKVFPYGDGRASDRIAEAIVEFFDRGKPALGASA